MQDKNKEYFLILDIVVAIDSKGNYIRKRQRVPVSQEVYKTYWHFRNKEKYYEKVISKRLVDFDIVFSDSSKARLAANLANDDVTLGIEQKQELDTLMDKIKQVLVHFPKIQKKRFILYFIQEKSIAEIAQIEGSSERTVQRGLQEIRESLQGIVNNL